MTTTTTPAETVTTTSPAGAADAMMPITVTHLILIVVAVVLTILMIWWGMRLKRRRDAGVVDLEDRGAVERVGDAVPVEAPPVADPIAAAPFVAPTPIAPAPPPIADAPVPATAPADAAGGDLTLLKGLGPKVAGELQALGVRSIADLATLTPERAEAIDADLGVFRGRMARDRWVEQARLLAAGDRAGYEAVFGKLGG